MVKDVLFITQGFKKEQKKYANNISNTSRTQQDKNMTINLSRSAKTRLRWMEHFAKFRSARLTCRHFGLSPDTFYLWKRRFNPKDLTTLEDNFRTRRPIKLRASKHEVTFLDVISHLKNTKSKIDRKNILNMFDKINHPISSSTINRLIKKHLHPMNLSRQKRD